MVRNKGHSGIVEMSNVYEKQPFPFQQYHYINGIPLKVACVTFWRWTLLTLYLPVLGAVVCLLEASFCLYFSWTFFLVLVTTSDLLLPWCLISALHKLLSLRLHSHSLSAPTKVSQQWGHYKDLLAVSYFFYFTFKLNKTLISPPLSN